MRFSHAVHAFKTKSGTLVPTRDYGTDPTGAVRKTGGSTGSREDKRRALGAARRAQELLKLGRLTRAQAQARANAVGYSIKSCA